MSRATDQGTRGEATKKGWSGRSGLNRRPPAPKAGALPLGHAPMLPPTRRVCCEGMPPGRLERPPPAPEAGALSTELRGHTPTIAGATVSGKGWGEWRGVWEAGRDRPSRRGRGMLHQMQPRQCLTRRRTTTTAATTTQAPTAATEPRNSKPKGPCCGEVRSMLAHSELDFVI